MTDEKSGKPEAPPGPILRVEDLSVTFGRQQVLKDINLDIQKEKRWPSLEKAAAGKRCS